eukprot:9372050-Alexandrium_andersonii.AAC.1
MFTGVLGSVGSVSVVFGAVDRVGSFGILLRSKILAGGAPPPWTPQEAPPVRSPAHFVQIRNPCQQRRGIHPPELQGPTL